MPEKAEAIYRELKRQFNVFYDERGRSAGGIAARTRRARPFCITVDGQTLADDTVTIRDRDSCRQWRVPSAGIAQALRDLLDGQPIPGGS